MWIKYTDYQSPLHQRVEVHEDKNDETKYLLRNILQCHETKDGISDEIKVMCPATMVYLRCYLSKFKANNLE